jgi:hypothetical protein
MHRRRPVEENQNNNPRQSREVVKDGNLCKGKIERLALAETANMPCPRRVRTAGPQEIT